MTVRRVVTGVDSTGRSRLVSDGVPGRTVDLPDYPGVLVEQVWGTDQSRLDQRGFEDESATGLYPPAEGARFLRNTYPPGFGTAAPEAADALPVQRLLMHRSDTVDFGIVLAGELTLVLEDGSETVLTAGDLVVQNGVMHGWRNAGPATAVVVFVLVGRAP